MALASAINQGVIGYFSQNNIPIPQVKTVLHGAQLVSRGLKERNQKMFGAIPYVRQQFVHPLICYGAIHTLDVLFGFRLYMACVRQCL